MSVAGTADAAPDIGDIHEHDTISMMASEGAETMSISRLSTVPLQNGTNKNARVTKADTDNKEDEGWFLGGQKMCSGWCDPCLVIVYCLVGFAVMA